MRVRRLSGKQVVAKCVIILGKDAISQCRRYDVYAKRAAIIRYLDLLGFTLKQIGSLVGGANHAPYTMAKNLGHMHHASIINAIKKKSGKTESLISDSFLKLKELKFNLGMRCECCGQKIRKR